MELALSIVDSNHDAASQNEDLQASVGAKGSIVEASADNTGFPRTREHHGDALNKVGGGDRQGNSAVWRIVIVRMSSDPQTRAYVQRRTKEGLTKTEIVRCLKRYATRETYALLPHELLS